MSVEFRDMLIHPRTDGGTELTLKDLKIAAGPHDQREMELITLLKQAASDWAAKVMRDHKLK